MRLLTRPRVLVGIIAGLVLLSAAMSFAYLSFNARRIFNAQISSLTQRKVEAHAVKAEFPAGLLVEGLSIEGIFTCERARVTVDPLSLFGHKVRISMIELDRPIGVWDLGVTATGEAVPASTKSSSAEMEPRRVTVKHLLIHEGALKIISRSADGAVSEHQFERIELRADNVPLTAVPARTDFVLTMSLVRMDIPFIGNFLKARGWLNWAARDMEASVQTVDDDGRVGVDARLVSQQNDLTVSGSARLTGAQGPQALGKKVSLVENVVLGALSSTDTDIETGFSFTTRMDRPAISNVHLKGFITTGLNSSATSGNIVAGLKAVGEELLKDSTQP